MLSKEDNELVTNTDPGTPMGELFRRFWLPIALAEELPGPDCAPIRVKVLSEDLIAFRDSSGRPGLVDAYCPHRGAPMFFGRNEEDGLRCVYHGWKFDVSGACVDLPNAPEGETFKHKVQIKSYPCVDAGRLVFAYMGPKEKKPPFPEFEWTRMSLDHVYVTKFRLECNYLQAMEGDYDPGHGPFLHTTLDDVHIPNPLYPQARQQNQIQTFNRPMDPNEPFPRAVGSRRVNETAKQSWGYLEDNDSGLWSIRGQEKDGKASAFVSPWMMPIYCTAGIAGPNTYSTNMRIPIDQKSLMFYRLRWSYAPIPEKDLDEYKHGEFFYPAVIPGTWTPRDNVHNDYNINRVAQKYFTYSGIKTFPLQDIAMMENQWGPLANRELEHLTSSDYQIIYIRRRLLKTAKALAEGIEPSEPWHPEAYRYHTANVTIEGSLDEAVRQAKALASESRVEGAKVAPQIAV
jgi:phenylpropionate dioxygenase-like ring-hydroxylating dioxygenase large terminal subunit